MAHPAGAGVRTRSTVYPRGVPYSVECVNSNSARSASPLTSFVHNSFFHVVSNPERSCLKRWNAGGLEVHAIEVSSNRIRVAIECPEVSADVAWLQFEEQSGLLVASFPAPGFIDALEQGPRDTFEIALAGLYKLAAGEGLRERGGALARRERLRRRRGPRRSNPLRRPPRSIWRSSCSLASPSCGSHASMHSATSARRRRACSTARHS